MAKDCFNAGMAIANTIRNIGDAFHSKDAVHVKRALEDAAHSAKNLGKVAVGKVKGEAGAIMKTAARLAKQKAPASTQVAKLLTKAKELRSSAARSCKTLPAF